MCMFLPESSKEIICDQLNNIEYKDIQTLSISLKNALIALNVLIESQNEQIGYLKDAIAAKLDSINYDIFRIKINSADITPGLRALKKEIDKIKNIKVNLDAIDCSFNKLEASLDQHILLSHSDIDHLIEQIEKVLLNYPNNQQIVKILSQLDKLNKTNKEILFDRIAGLSSIIGLVLAII